MKELHFYLNFIGVIIKQELNVKCNPHFAFLNIVKRSYGIMLEPSQIIVPIMLFWLLFDSL